MFTGLVCNRCGRTFQTRHASKKPTARRYCSTECRWAARREPSTDYTFAHFWARVEKTATCWLWMGSRHKTGYGQLYWNGRTTRATHVAWESTNGPVPIGIFVLHTCDNPPCVNPDHLFLGTHLTNAQDKEFKGRGHQPRGERNSHAKLTTDQVMAIRNRYTQGSCTYGGLATEYGVGDEAIRRIVLGMTWLEEVRDAK